MNLIPFGLPMAKDRLSSKLAVILHADVVGSTSLVQQNETLAHERILAAFHNFSETIKGYGGIARELRGDALVAEFDWASDVVAYHSVHQYKAGKPKNFSIKNASVESEMFDFEIGERIAVRTDTRPLRSLNEDPK